MPPTTLRTATEADAPEIATLYLATRADALPNLRRVHTDDEVRAWISTTLLRRGTTWVACQDTRIVGFLTLHGNDVDQLYLLPGTYRQGIGTQLLEHAKSNSAGRLHLYTFQCNTRARAFYEKHGFTPTRFGDGSGNEENEPDILYEWHRPARRPL